MDQHTCITQNNFKTATNSASVHKFILWELCSGGLEGRMLHISQHHLACNLLKPSTQHVNCKGCWNQKINRIILIPTTGSSQYEITSYKGFSSKLFTEEHNLLYILKHNAILNHYYLFETRESASQNPCQYAVCTHQFFIGAWGPLDRRWKNWYK